MVPNSRRLMILPKEILLLDIADLIHMVKKL
nr:MAG TPA: hypothetical protein [Caudoviricetes sp.]